LMPYFSLRPGPIISEPMAIPGVPPFRPASDGT
jgi:hypothetical protein